MAFVKIEPRRRMGGSDTVKVSFSKPEDGFGYLNAYLGSEVIKKMGEPKMVYVYYDDESVHKIKIEKALDKSGAFNLVATAKSKIAKLQIKWPIKIADDFKLDLREVIPTFDGESIILEI
jgi:hypothetical protein